MFSCYVSLDTVLHGREEPFRKLPAPFLVALDPFIRMNLAEKVSPDWNENYKRGRGHCEVTWPQVSCTGLEATHRSVAALFTQGRTKVNVIKTRNGKVSKQFSHIMSSHQNECEANGMGGHKTPA